MLNSNMTNHIIIQLNKQEKMLLISFVLNVKGHAWQTNSIAIPLWLGRSCSNEHKQYNPDNTDSQQKQCYSHTIIVLLI